jgi:3-hydroxyisobutyrate dehydrogenase-like beta-hydroxyacid dehydrogenase
MISGGYLEMKISVLGLGMMGSLWARQLGALGHEVRGWNRTPLEFPGFTASLSEAVREAEVIFIVVADPPAVQSILDGILPELRAGHLVIQSSTVAPRDDLSYAAQVAKTGAQFLEAPFAGSKVVNGKLQTTYYLGGDAAVVKKARPLLETISSALIHVGPVGSAASLKLAMNLNMAGVAQALCESLSLTRAAGIADDVFFEALSRNSSHSKVADGKKAKLIAHDYAPQFSLKHMAKDVRLALETAATFSLTLAQTTKLKETYDRALTAGWGSEDFIGLIRATDKVEG